MEQNEKEKKSKAMPSNGKDAEQMDSSSLHHSATMSEIVRDL